MSNDTQSVVVGNNIREQELLASLVYHPFKAQVSQRALTNIADIITYNYREITQETLLECATQVLLNDPASSSAHTADEIARIAFGMVQRAHETDVFAPTHDELMAKQFIH